MMMEKGHGVGGDNNGPSSAHDVASFGWSTSPAPVFATTGWEEAELSEVVASGWGDDCEAGVETVDGRQRQAHDDDDAEQQDGREEKSEEDDEATEDDEDDYYYSEDEMDEDDTFYASIEDETEAAGGVGVQVQPPEKNSLANLFRLPLDLMYRGSFYNAMVHAAKEDKFLIVNFQTRAGAGDFPSQLQNRDLWAHEVVKNVVSHNFVFLLLQKMSQNHYSVSDECSKVSTLYKLRDDQLPAVLVLDPITGLLLAQRSGAMTPGEFIEYVGEYTESKPSALGKPSFTNQTLALSGAGGGEQESASTSAAVAVIAEEQPAPGSSEPAAEAGEQELETPDDSAAAGAADACSEQEHVPVPESPPEEVDDDLPLEGEKMYKLKVRFPDGTMVVKEFGCNRRVASLFAFCRSAVHGGAEAGEKKAFRIIRFAGRAWKAILGDGGATFQDLGLNCAAVSVVFDS